MNTDIVSPTSTKTFIHLGHDILHGIKPTFESQHGRIGVILPSANFDLNSICVSPEAEMESDEHYLFDVADFLHKNMSGYNFRMLIEAMQSK